ncbi:MAG: substrate-binding domain-containing protein [Desulfobacterales bacterium]|nr:substrate-binding domain-containing protein [Desulfobacterales bacterium]
MKGTGSPAKGFILLIALLALMFGAAWAAEPQAVMMATTTSTDDTGLLDYLAPHFKTATGYELRWTATGTGKALELGKNCDVDVLLVHAPKAEMKFVEEGNGINRTLVMYNDFVITGPAADPAGIKGKTVAEALSAIAAKKSPFVSRGDNSGTHKMEQELWTASNLPLPEKESWYISTGQGMLVTINVAAEKNGYTLTDRGTYIKYESDKAGKAPQVILVEGDAPLLNQYSVIEVNPKRCAKVNNMLAHQFAVWVTGPQAQKLIQEFKLMGKPLFTPNAKR